MVSKNIVEETVCVFAYAFPHKKTQDFLSVLNLHGYKHVVVFAAPKEKLKSIDRNTYFQNVPSVELVQDTKGLCEIYGYDYVECKHADVDTISRNVKEKEIQKAFISGARIINGDIISLFSWGIVNIHPGKLPETSGLDALFYSIKNSVEPGVTAHFINHKVDDGDQIDFYEYELRGDESLGELNKVTYEMQLNAFHDVLDRIRKDEIIREPVKRPKKNKPMAPNEKLSCIEQFPLWRSYIHLQQLKKRLSKICAIGSVEQYNQLDPNRLFLNQSIERWWTPLVIAVHHKRYDLAKFLIEEGADVNYATPKGTTVLMYAKTDATDENDGIKILELLIEQGADANFTDCFGKTASEYLGPDANPALTNILKRS
jgi:phosphoribosylglycinamide formyltransferase-1